MVTSAIEYSASMLGGNFVSRFVLSAMIWSRVNREQMSEFASHDSILL